MANDVQTTTLLSLFHNREHANAALQDLQTAGIPTNAIQTLSGTGKDASQSLASLKALELPEGDLRMISEGLTNGGSLLVVRTQHALAEKAEDIFERYNSRQVDEKLLGAQPQARTRAATADAVGDTVIPIVEEQLVVGKRKVQSGGMRVFSRMVETPVEEQVVLQEEHARIERHAVNRPISSADLDAMQNQTVEVREMSEEAVVGKAARVVEEVSIGKETTQRTQQIHDTVRKTQVEVDELTATDTTTRPVPKR